MTWDILTCSIPHRDGMLLDLLAEFDRQMIPGVGVIVCRDNLQATYGGKTAAMLAHSTADYVSCVDDDDMIAPDYVARIWEALQSKPDYVGFVIRWTIDGVRKPRVEHTLRHGPGWHDYGHLLTRDISEKNPIRRDLALLGPWEGGYEAERRWADGVRASGRCVTEVWIDAELYYYRFRDGDYFQTPRSPLPVVPDLPSYPWLTVIAP